MTTLKLEAQQSDGGGGGDVTREYVDQRDAVTLDSANGYTDLVANGKQNTLTAGANIIIENDVISSTGSTTTVAWGGITGTLSNQTDLNSALGDKQDVLTAGDNITIENNVISADGITGVSWGDIDGDLADQTDLSNALGNKQDTLTAGANISIDANNEISATDTTYTAGANITIDANNEISATDTTYTAGTNISISAQNEISATDTTYSDFVGTDGITDGDNGLVPAPITSDVDKYLKSDGTWATVQTGSTITMQSTDPGEGQPLAANNFIAVY